MELSDQHFRLLVESVRDYAIYLLDPEGRVASWNAGAARLKGYAPGEIIGRSFGTFFREADQTAGRPRMLLDTALRDGRVEDVGWRVRKDGSQFWASAVITTLYDQDGNHVGFAKVTRDLTDRAYRSFIEATHAIIWTTDASGAPNTDSPSWREFTGQTEEDWRGRLAFAPVHPDDVPALQASWTAARAAHTRFYAEFRLRRRDGEYVWMSAQALPFLNPDGSVREWFGVTSDISDRKRAELERERALELWRTTLRSIGDAVIATDARGVVTFMNPVAEQLTGWSGNEAAGHPLADVFRIFNEDSGAAVENPVHKVLRDGVVVGLANHTILRTKSGKEVPIDDSAAPIRGPDGAVEGVVLVFRDATAEKRAGLRRAYLARATEVLVTAADYREALTAIATLAVPRLADWAAVEIVDASTGRPQQLAVAHVDPAKVDHARELNRRYPPDPDAATGVPNVVRTGRAEIYPSIPRELLEAGARDDEHLRIIRELDLRSAMVVPLRGKQQVLGAITFVYAGSDRRYGDDDLAFAQELADRAALIIERRRAEEEAAIANRMKDEFLATISHELRTPLQAILGYASLLERGSAQDPAKALAAIVRNAEAQARLVEDILDTSRIVSGKLKLTTRRFELASAIRAAVDAVRPAAAARLVRLVETLPADLGDIDGDFDRIQQIVWNLVSNAVKFTDSGGLVEVTGQRGDTTVKLVVRDTGRGIPREHLAAIFERFRQVDSSTTRQHGGLGLGLAIVRYLVEAHGGTVSADSAGPGTGATFTVVLPAHRTVATDDQPARAAKPAMSPLHGIHVLVVDDDDDARELIAEALAEAGATVDRASSAADAFAQVQTGRPQVLVSDISMPGEDGCSLLRRVRALPRENGGGVPAIALTAYARPEDVRNTEQAGFQIHVAKPVRLERLIDAIRMCVVDPGPGRSSPG